MNIKQAVDRIGWRFGIDNPNPFKINKADAEAYDTIVDYVESQQKKQFNDYQLFAKLYVFVYGSFLRYYKATVFDTHPKKEIDQILKKPFEQLVEEFKTDLNESELYQIIDNSLSHVHPSHYRDQNLAHQKKAEDLRDFIKRLESNEPVKNMIVNNIDIWDYQTVLENLVSQINNTINDCR